MKNQIIMMVSALFLLASCKKDELPKVTYPEPPTTGIVFYKIYNSPPAGQTSEIYIRKITFLADYTVDSQGKISPIYKDTIVTGDFFFSFSMKPHRQLSKTKSNDPNKTFFEYILPINIGWKNTDGKYSFTKVEAGVIENGKEKISYYGGGGCLSSERPILTQICLYYFPGLNGIGVYDR